MAEIIQFSDIAKPAPKITLGQQIYENHLKYAGQFTQEVRETTDAMGVEYMASLNKCIDANSHIRSPYYIYEVLRPNAALPNVIECKHIARLTHPLPEWGTSLYRVDNKAGEWWYLWGLPHRVEAASFMENPLGYEQKTIKDIIRFKKYLSELPTMIPPEDVEALQHSAEKRFEATNRLLSYWNSLFNDEAR